VSCWRRTGIIRFRGTGPPRKNSYLHSPTLVSPWWIQKVSSPHSFPFDVVSVWREVSWGTVLEIRPESGLTVRLKNYDCTRCRYWTKMAISVIPVTQAGWRRGDVRSLLSQVRRQSGNLALNLDEPCTDITFSVNGEDDLPRLTTSFGITYSVSQKNPPQGIWHFFIFSFFHKRLRIFSRFFTHLLCAHIFARLQICIQLYPTLTKLCHIKRDCLVHVICSKCPPSAETRAFRRLRKSLTALLAVACGKSL